jgi:hypothetical protein
MEYILKANPRILGWLFGLIKDGEWRKMTNEENERLKNDLNWLIIFEYYDFKLKIEEDIYKIKFQDSDWFNIEYEKEHFRDVGLDVLIKNCEVEV